jgi:4-hydroxy-tetrahydrodipicolinate reductase
MIRVVLQGCHGRMGRAVAEAAQGVADLQIVAGIDRAQEGGARPFPVFPSLEACPVDADIILDFSSPDALSSLISEAARRTVPLVIGTTGHSEQQKAALAEASSRIPIFYSPNLSHGINLMCDLVQKAAAELGDAFDVEIVEAHHNRKADSPSATAVALAAAVNRVFLDSKRLVFGRRPGEPRRTAADIGVHSLRGGTLAGQHAVVFAGADEVLEVRHSASSLAVYAAGAIQAARYMAYKPAGMYTMRDMIVENSAITNLSRSDDEALVSLGRVPGDPRSVAAVFRRIGEAGINVDMISQTVPEGGEVSISFTLPRAQLPAALAVLGDLATLAPGIRATTLPEATKISVEGAGMERQSGVAARVFDLMAASGISIRTVTTSETKISYIIDRADADRAVEAIQQSFGV